MSAAANPSDTMLESCIALEHNIGVYEFEDHDLFDLEEPIWVLGLEYQPKAGIDDMKRDVISRPWCTYRRNFDPIGGTGPTSDQGWGCMLRCGQMLLAHTLVTLHLGRQWRWFANDHPARDAYLPLLRHFQDKKDKLYSLHQIAQMGVSEGKQIGEWFGPNTTAQVLKKLCVYDDHSQLAVHIAMDNALIIEDVVKTCRARASIRRQHSSHSPQVASCSGESDLCGDAFKTMPIYDADYPSLPSSMVDAGKADSWRPLLLIVPLRLGLSSLNPCYKEAIKQYFRLPQCAGMMGGRPNHALYFVGCAGDQLLYLDPHNCQDTVDLDGPTDGVDDCSYHCPYTLHMDMENVDPSLALAFLCPAEADFQLLCRLLKETVLPLSKPPILELLEERPGFLPKFLPYVGEDTPRMADFTLVEPKCDSDEEFVILDA